MLSLLLFVVADAVVANADDILVVVNAVLAGVSSGHHRESVMNVAVGSCRAVVVAMLLPFL